MIGVALGALFLDRSDVWMPHAHILISGRFRPDQNPNATAMAGGVPRARTVNDGGC